jgi:flagellar biosynthesis anti-sigma factor FlgM
MKPIGTNPQPPISPINVRGDNNPVAAVTTPTAQSGGSNVSSRLGSNDIVDQGAPIDTARIAQIRDAIAGGSYAIDTDKLSDKMIEMDLLPASAG